MLQISRTRCFSTSPLLLHVLKRPHLHIRRFRPAGGAPSMENSSVVVQEVLMVSARRSQHSYGGGYPPPPPPLSSPYTTGGYTSSAPVNDNGYGAYSSHYDTSTNPYHHSSPPSSAASTEYRFSPYSAEVSSGAPHHTTSAAVPAALSPSSTALPLGSAGNPIVVSTATNESRRSNFFSLLLFFLIFNGLYNLAHIMYSGPMVGSGAGIDDGHPVFGRMLNNTAPQPVDLDSLDVTFSTIRGCDEAKEELQDLVEFLKDPEKFTALGGRLPKGVLLVGPPGCGKTLLAKAIAKEAGVSFFYASASEFDEVFVGVGPRRIRDIFAAAKKASPSVIFIDEIDALATRRTNVDQGTSRMSLNQLLSEMDGFQSSSSVIVIAATNTPEVLDKAITRPGRLDTVISVDPPDMKGRADVLQLYLDKVTADPSVKAMDIARGTSGFTGAELSNLVNIAAIRAATLSRKAVTMDDVEYAKDRVMMGSESKKAIPEEERRITAFHEGGHALAALLLQSEGAEPIHKATIVPRGNGIMGLVQQLPEKDKYSQTKRQCMARLKVCLAGRIGEEMILGDNDVTTGASSDFQQASDMARNMIRRFGFSDRLGLVFFAPTNTPDGAYISDETKKQIDEEVQRLISTAYAEAKQLLYSNKDKLTRIANGLLQRETLTGEEIEKLTRGETLPPMTEKPVRTETTKKKPSRPNFPMDRRPVPIS